MGSALLFVIGRLTGRRPYGWGLVLTGAVVIGLATRFRLDPGLLWRLVPILALGSFVDVVSSRRAHPAVLASLWALAGLSVWALVPTEPAWPPWSSVFFAFAVVGLALGIWWLGRLPQSDLVGPMFAISVIGAWVTVPETDLVSVLLGVALPMALVTLRPVRASASATGALAAASLFVWLSVDGGAIRPWTFVAAVAASVTIPLAAIVLSGARAGPSRPAVLVTHVAYVVLITRVADYTESVVVVLLVSLGVLGLAVATVSMLPESGDAES